MAVGLKCDCGRAFRVKDELKGRRVRCPDCGDPVTVPSAGTASVRRQRSASAEVAAPPPRKRRSNQKRVARKRRSAAAQKSNVPLFAMAGTAAAIVIGVMVFLFMRPGSDGADQLVANVETKESDSQILEDNPPESLPGEPPVSEAANVVTNTVPSSSLTAAVSAPATNSPTLDQMSIPAEPQFSTPPAPRSDDSAPLGAPVKTNTNVRAYTENGGGRDDIVPVKRLPESAKGTGKVSVIVENVRGSGLSRYLTQRMTAICGKRPSRTTLSQGTMRLSINSIGSIAALADCIDFGTVSSISGDTINVTLERAKVPTAPPQIEDTNMLNFQLNTRFNTAPPLDFFSRSAFTSQDVANVIENLTHWDSGERETAVKWLFTRFERMEAADKQRAVEALNIRKEDVAKGVKEAAIAAIRILTKEKQKPEGPAADGVKVVVANVGVDIRRSLEITKQLRDVTRAANISTQNENGKMFVLLRPSGDLNQLAKRIKFGKVERVDLEARTIYVTVSK